MSGRSGSSQSPRTRFKLMIPGPGELHAEDLRLLGSQATAHYGDAWVRVHAQVIERLGRLLGAPDPYLIPGTGSTCLDAVLFNLFEAGQRVVVPDTGYFGRRLAEMARTHRLEVIEVPVEVGSPVDVGRVGKALAGADGVLVVHVETSTGVRHPVEGIARQARDAGVVSVVDAISSAGGERLCVEGMGIDALVTASQKGLEGPAGLGVIALGTGGRERLESRSEPPDSWYLDLKRWDRHRVHDASWEPHPVTMPTNLVSALSSSVRRILEVGANEWVRRRGDLAAHCREGLRRIGLKPVANEGSQANLVVAAWADDPTCIAEHVLDETGIVISRGLEPLAGRTIRVGLIGRTATHDMVDRLLASISGALSGVRPGSSAGQEHA
jgi:alanine-glyoxylate transaminase/serine-glyoxylate transaminase/serine-pyruvate transaminase